MNTLSILFLFIGMLIYRMATAKRRAAKAERKRWMEQWFAEAERVRMRSAYWR